MHTLRFLSALAATSLCLPAQNWVTNGDFGGGLTGWTQTNYSYNPTLETYDVTGTGASACFACSPGGQALPGPFPASTLDQSVIVVTGVPYEISADLTCTVAPSASALNDLTTVTAEVAGVQVAKLVFGAMPSAPLPKEYRGRLCGRFVPAAAGPQPLSLKFARATVANLNTPRVRIDNITLQMAVGPTFNIDAARRIAKTLPFVVDGAPGAPYSVFVASAALPSGLVLPGITGQWFLDPATTAVLLSGTLDAGGKATTNVAVPNLPWLTLAATFFQPAQIAGGTAQLGFHHGAVFTQ